MMPMNVSPAIRTAARGGTRAALAARTAAVAGLVAAVATAVMVVTGEPASAASGAPAPRRDAVAIAAPPRLPVVAGDLAADITGVQQMLQELDAWIRSAEDAVRQAIGQIIWAAPGYLPNGVDLSSLMGTIAGLPDALRQALAATIAQWQGTVQPGTPAAAHQQYVTASPQLAHDAIDVAVTSAAVEAANVRQDAASAVASQSAAAVTADPAVPAAALAARQAAATLLQGAPQIPSARAGIEMLVAGMGAGMQAQADFSTALADRLAVLAQQMASVSTQLAALGETAAVETARDAEQDRQGLDARLGLMDAARAGGQALTEMLAGADEQPDVELPLAALY
jgi:hypothetical protein